MLLIKAAELIRPTNRRGQVFYVRSMINAVTVRRTEYYIYHGLELSADEPQPLELALNDCDPPPLVYSTRSYRFAIRHDLFGSFLRRGVRLAPACVSRVFSVTLSESDKLLIRSSRYDSAVTKYFMRRSRLSNMYEGQYAELVVDSLRYGDAGVFPVRVQYEWGAGRSEILEELSRDAPAVTAIRGGTALVLCESLFAEIAPYIDFQYFKVGKRIPEPPTGP